MANTTRHDSGEMTIPMSATEVAAALAQDAEHHAPAEHPTRPDLSESGEVSCPACHAGLNMASCPTCNCTGSVLPSVFAAFHAERGE